MCGPARAAAGEPDDADDGEDEELVHEELARLATRFTITFTKPEARGGGGERRYTVPSVVVQEGDGSRADFCAPRALDMPARTYRKPTAAKFAARRLALAAP